MEGSTKPPLITPSISPPPPFFPPPFKISSSAPPAKRRRISPTSRQLQPTSHSSLNLDDPVHLEKARDDSAFRLWDAWSQLEDRYARGLDEDDIIDLTAQEIVKDRGVIRGVKKQWKFGCAVGGEGEAEEDTDDLDAISDKSSVEENPLVERFRHVPPVTEMDPADAEDLKRFLEAERRRKELCPDEAEDSEESEHERVLRNPVRDKRPPSDPARVETPEQGGSRCDASPKKRTNQPTHEKAAKLTTPDDHPIYYVDSGSDDELDVNWKLDEASAVYRVRKVEDLDDSDIEVIGPPTQISSGPRHSQTQLHTPPRSQVSLSSATPSDDIFSTFQSSSLPPSSPPASSPPPSSPLPSSPLSSPKKPLFIARSRSQLHTPSRSNSSPKASTSHTQLAPIPRLDLSRLEPRVTPRAKPKIPNNRERDEVSPPSSPSYTIETNRLSHATHNLPSYNRAKSMVVEVVLNRRPTPESSPPRASSSVTKSAITKTPVAKRSKSQNKGERKINIPPVLTDTENQLGDSDGSLTIRLPPHSPKKTAPVPLKVVAPTRGARSMASVGPSRLPEPPPPSRTNKRKRVISISSSCSEREEAPQQARPVFLRPARKQDCVSENENTSGYASEVEEYSRPSRRAKSRPRSRHRSMDRHHQRSQVAPLPLPQAEFIISQVVHQLSALFGDTNKHHRRSNSVYNTPSRRRHPHPHSSDPGLLIATSPPACPEPSSPLTGTERRKSLVRRSQSRGRRVSFKLDCPDPGSSSINEDIDDTNPQSYHPEIGKTPQAQTPQLTRNRGQGNRAESSNSKSLDTQPTNRGRKTIRGQTPAPLGVRKK